MTKPYKLAAADIKPIAQGFGACLATDHITVEGRKVGFMYREAPDNAVDSGWRFLSGLEDQDYMDNPAFHAVYDVNTIANYDPDIIPFLTAPAGSAFERRNSKGAFVEIEFDPNA